MHMLRVIVATVILILIAAGLTIYRNLPSQTKTQISSTNPSPRQSSNDNPEEKIEVIAQNLAVPWALAFLDNGSILVTERKGTIKLIAGDRSVKEIGQIEVNQQGESGLHGVAIDPNFEQNKLVYFYYTYSSENSNSSNGQGSSLNRVSQFTFNGDKLSNEKVLVNKIPGATIHDGGRIKFGPDGALYITTGDAANPSLAQDKDSLAGKILRFKDGSVNVYSYGHRNPQGITWDDKGQLWETEHGPSTKDEVNLIEQGKNYGWSIVTGEQEKEGMTSPKKQSGPDTWAPAGLAFFNGSLFFGGLRGQALFELNTQTLQLKEHFKGEFGRIRDVVLGSDNLLYITTSNQDGRGNPKEGDDKILRIKPFN